MQLCTISWKKTSGIDFKQSNTYTAHQNEEKSPHELLIQGSEDTNTGSMRVDMGMSQLPI